jgi:hypothetical protein
MLLPPSSSVDPLFASCSRTFRSQVYIQSRVYLYTLTIFAPFPFVFPSRQAAKPKWLFNICPAILEEGELCRTLDVECIMLAHK